MNRISDISMEEIYRHIIENASSYEDFPMQIIVVDSMPEYVNIEHQSEEIICFLENNKKTGLCLVLNSENVLNVLTETITGTRTVQGYEVDSIENATGINVNTNCSVKRLIQIYRHALSICNDLKIRVPLILVSNIDGELRGRRDAFPTADILYISPQSLPRMIHTMAHELRHCWQAYQGAGFYKTYKDFSEIGAKYMWQPEEIDADAYACLYLDSLGYDGMRMAFETDEEYEDPFWETYKKIIKNQMAIISEKREL